MVLFPKIRFVTEFVFFLFFFCHPADFYFIFILFFWVSPLSVLAYAHVLVVYSNEKPEI